VEKILANAAVDTGPIILIGLCLLLGSEGTPPPPGMCRRSVDWGLALLPPARRRTLRTSASNDRQAEKIEAIAEQPYRPRSQPAFRGRPAQCAIRLTLDEGNCAALDGPIWRGQEHLLFKMADRPGSRPDTRQVLSTGGKLQTTPMRSRGA